MILGGIIGVTFQEVTNPGYLTYSFTSIAALPGQTSLMSNTGIALSGDTGLRYSGDIEVTTPYYTGTLSEEQQNNIQAYKLAAAGGVDGLSTSVNLSSATATATTNTLGTIAFYTPAYSTTYGYLQDDMGFRSGESDVTGRKVESTELADLVAALEVKNKLTASNVYFLGPENKTFSPAAAVGFNAGASTDSAVDIYEFNADLSSFIKLPKTRVNMPGGSFYMASVPQIHSYFALLQSSEPAVVELAADTTAPVTEAIFSMPDYEADGKRMIPGISDIYLYALDPEIPGSITSSVATTYYLVDADTTTNMPNVYTDSFTLSEGSHTLKYASVDEVGNSEDIKTSVVYVDSTPPTTSFNVDGSSSVENGIVYAVYGATVSLDAEDPVSSGVASGLMTTFYLVDVSTHDCEGVLYVSTAPEGTCQNPYYTAPFIPEVGNHIIYYASLDNVTNVEALHFQEIDISSERNNAMMQGESMRAKTAMPKSLNIVAQPVVESISPSTAAVISSFTLTGYNLGEFEPGYTQVLIGGTTAPITRWTNTKIQGRLPVLPAGRYLLQVLKNGLTESVTSYINIEEPVISSMTPLSGAADSTFNIYGTGFGPYEVAIAKVIMGGTNCDLTLWSDTRITGTVPSGLGTGAHSVAVLRGAASSNGLDYMVAAGGFGPAMVDTNGINAEFKLGEVYVYPDPAKNGKAPIFHIEVGMADTVKLKIYTVAGELDHAATITGIPQGIGSTYAYEYAWEGHIASGVYYYTVEAERAGKKLRAKGKFSVIR